MTAAQPGWRVRALRLAVAGNVDADKQRRAVRDLLAAGRTCEPAEVVAALRRHGGCDDAELRRAQRRLAALGAKFVLAGDDGYPAPLSAAWPDLGAPLWVFSAGDPTRLDTAPAVAIVGTRRPTLDGLRTARMLSAALAGAGVVIVSGLARGIDQAAHEAALEAGGETVAVLGTGLGVDYPAGSTALRSRIAERGALLTELAPGVGPKPWQFVARNRIISGLAAATVVVEGGPTSGALQTARFAAEQGRDVWAVPGSVNAHASQAPLALLRDGAYLLTTPDELLTSLTPGGLGDVGSVAAPVDRAGADPAGAHLAGTDPAGADRAGADPAAGEEEPGAALSEPARSVLALLSAVPATVDELVTASRLPAQVVMAALGEVVAAGCGATTAQGVVRA